MKRLGWLWIGFATCLAVVLAAMGWVSLTVVELDRAQLEARHQAALEENVRLALWRMDSALAPLVGQESARPYFAYSTFLPVDRAYGRMFNRSPGGEVLLPSPLLGESLPYVLVHFQFDPEGRLTSPNVPTETQYRLAVPRYVSEDVVRKTKAALAGVAAIADRKRLMAILPESKTPVAAEVVISPSNQSAQPAQQSQAVFPNAEQQVAQQGQRAEAQQKGRGSAEFFERNVAVQMNTSTVVGNGGNLLLPVFGSAEATPLAATDISGVLMTPLWIDGNLLLARRVAVGGKQYVQGCLLDWPQIRQWLLKTVGDLLPEADLKATEPGTAENEGRMLAALPLRLVAGELPWDPDVAAGPIRLSLVVAWACVLLAATAVAALLAGVVRLSERRAAFVSAVTHELRTPLTTFHMYTEMLAEGMVSDPATERSYLNTLRVEASRLSHLVENVLAYARLERGRARGRIEPVAVGEFLQPIASRLSDRAAQAGMSLAVDGADEALAAVVSTNPSVIEQVLFNLVDNACKYATGASDKRIHLTVRRLGPNVQLRVSDHGPGISGSMARRLFRPFSKSAHEAANSAPGIGLGLALSHRLARDVGARLDFEPGNSHGAAFVLVLPVVG